MSGPFEQVPTGTRAQGPDRCGFVAVHRQHENGRARDEVGDLTGGFDPVDAGHLDIHQHDVRLEEHGLPDRLVPRGRFSDDVEAIKLAQDQGEPVPDDGVVVSDQDTYGHTSFWRMSVPTGAGKCA